MAKTKTQTIEAPVEETTSKSRRSDLFHFDPADIILRENLRGRRTPTELEVKLRAISIYNHGQQTPVKVRTIEGKQLLLIMGFTRHDAISLLRKGFEHEGKFYHIPDLLIKTLKSNANEETAFIDNIVENAHRNATSAIDDAENQEKMRDRFGKSDAEIAELYEISVQQVGNLKRLLSLSSKHQTMVHLGTMPVNAALDLLDVAEDKRDEIVKAATHESGKVRGNLVRAQVREINLGTSAPATPTTNEPKAKTGTAPKTATTGTAPKAKGRSIRELKDFFKAEALVDGPSGELAKKMIALIDGAITTADMKSAWDSSFMVPVATHHGEASLV